MEPSSPISNSVQRACIDRSNENPERIAFHSNKVPWDFQLQKIDTLIFTSFINKRIYVKVSWIPKQTMLDSSLEEFNVEEK